MKVDDYRRRSAHLDGKLDDLWKALEALGGEVAEIRDELLGGDDQEDGDEDSPAPSGGVKATPTARALAAEHDVDLSELTGTGKSGYIVQGDVEDALED